MKKIYIRLYVSALGAVSNNCLKMVLKELYLVVRSDSGCGSDLREAGIYGFFKLCTPVPLSGRIELLLVQTGQKGQAGRFRGMFQLPGMFGRAERIAASAVLQILPAFFKGLLRGLADVHQRQQVGPAARAAVGVGVVFSAGWTG
jgi:hypothetical protein